MNMLVKLYKQGMEQAEWDRLRSMSYEQLEQLCQTAFDSCQTEQPINEHLLTTMTPH